MAEGDEIALKLGRADVDATLQHVAGCIITRFLLHSSLVDAFLHAAHDEFGSEFLRQFITIQDGFLKVMSRVDVQQREWNLCRIESLVGRYVITIESLPPEKRMTGRSNWAATSRST